MEPVTLGLIALAILAFRKKPTATPAEAQATQEKVSSLADQLQARGAEGMNEIILALQERAGSLGLAVKGMVHPPDQDGRTASAWIVAGSSGLTADEIGRCGFTETPWDSMLRLQFLAMKDADFTGAEATEFIGTANKIAQNLVNVAALQEQRRQFAAYRAQVDDALRGAMAQLGVSFNPAPSSLIPWKFVLGPGALAEAMALSSEARSFLLKSPEFAQLGTDLAPLVPGSAYVQAFNTDPHSFPASMEAAWDQYMKAVTPEEIEAAAQAFQNKLDELIKGVQERTQVFNEYFRAHVMEIAVNAYDYGVGMTLYAGDTAEAAKLYEEATTDLQVAEATNAFNLWATSLKENPWNPEIPAWLDANRGRLIDLAVLNLKYTVPPRTPVTIFNEQLAYVYPYTGRR